MSEQPIKLTDEVLARIAQDLSMIDNDKFAEQAINAIRAMRDRAKAVVESEHDDYGVGWIVNHVVNGDAMRALEEVLP